MRRIFAHTFALIGLLLLVGSALADAIPVPPLTAHVTDQTNILSSAEAQALETKLAAFEQSKGSQIAVLIVPTTGDESIEQYSIRVVDQWKLGRKGIDDGVLLLLALDDHKVRIEVGRGLEGAIPDAIANRIIDEDMTPKFVVADIAGGIDAAVDRMIGLINGESFPPPKPQNDIDWYTVGDSFAPPPLGAWVGSAVAAIFAFFITAAMLGHKSALLRGGCTALTVAVVWLIAGSGILFALILALPAAYIAGKYGQDDGPDIPIDWNARDRSSVSGWSILGGLASMAIGSALSGGGGSGGGGGFSGGGGGFSGGGASGSW